MKSAWDDPSMDERLRAGLAAGLSFPQVGRLLGVTKNAAIGRARRQGMECAQQRKPQPKKRAA